MMYGEFIMIMVIIRRRNTMMTISMITIIIMKIITKVITTVIIILMQITSARKIHLINSFSYSSGVLMIHTNYPREVHETGSIPPEELWERCIGD